LRYHIITNGDPLSDLILVPTPREMETIRLLLSGDDDRLAFQLCGFGPIAAAARAGALIARYKPERVLLVGIAGSFDTEKNPLGTACRFDEVTCFGIGVGSGINHQSAYELGWQQFSGGDAQPEIGDVVRLDSTFVQGVTCAGKLLTCCSASANLDEASEHHRLFPDAVAEDMEGFAVAMACSLARVPLQIVRGISNRVGDRDHANWRIDDALAAAAKMASRLMHRAWMPMQS
jgi:futalosine hydrolase